MWVCFYTQYDITVLLQINVVTILCNYLAINKYG